MPNRAYLTVFRKKKPPGQGGFCVFGLKALRYGLALELQSFDDRVEEIHGGAADGIARVETGRKKTARTTPLIQVDIQ